MRAVVPNPPTPRLADDPAEMLQRAHRLRDDGEHERAVELCLAACALSPHDAEVAALAAEFFGDEVPAWHFHIVRDRRRNDAYEAAIRRAVTPGCRVLEIGTGTGLLAMMAARAGAGAVISCEAEPAIARMATEIVARNGYAERVRVVAKHSTGLDPVADLGGSADVLVSEIFSNNLLGEGVLPALEDAWLRLLTPDAKVVPARGRICVALAEDAKAGDERLGMISGFDLSLFNRLAQPDYRIETDDRHLHLRSDPATLFAFDFQSPQLFSAQRVAIELAAHGGRVNGVIQWIALEMDGQDTYENPPARGNRSCWSAVFHPLPAAIETDGGEGVVVHGQHDRLKVRIWT
jgi:SAM-dependent methyltransferase